MTWLYVLLVSFYIVTCLFLMLVVLVQKSKGSMGLGSMGGSSQMLFGGSGGQDIFQKTTWFLGTLFMLLSFGLALMKTKQSQTFRYVKESTRAAQPVQAPATNKKS